MTNSIFKVSGNVRPAVPPADSKSLSLAEKTSVLKSMGLAGPGTVYAKLSPSRPEVVNHAALVFEHASVVEGGWDYATWRLLNPASWQSNADESVKERLGIWFKSEGASRRYLMDLTVNGGVATDFGSSQGVQAFKIQRPDGALVQNTMEPRAGAHILCAVETQDASWYGFQLVSTHSFTFWSCEITRL